MPPSRRALWVGGLSALAVLVLWTSFILVARASATRSLAPLDLAWLRFAFSGVVVLPLVAWRWGAMLSALGPTPRAALRRGAVLAGVAGIGYCMLAYSGFFFAPAAHGAVLLPGTLPLWTALLAWALLGERVSWARAGGLALIIAGAMFVGGASLWQALTGGEAWLGDLLFVAASMTWALYGVLCRRWRVGAVDATLAIALGCLVSYVPLYGAAVLSGWVADRLSLAPWSELIAQAVFQGGFAMLLAGLAFTQVVHTFGPVRTTLFTALVPPLAALAAVPVLGEALSTAAMLGLICVTLGLVTGLRAAVPTLLRRDLGGRAAP